RWRQVVTCGGCVRLAVWFRIYGRAEMEIGHDQVPRAVVAEQGRIRAVRRVAEVHLPRRDFHQVVLHFTVGSEAIGPREAFPGEPKPRVGRTDFGAGGYRKTQRVQTRSHRHAGENPFTRIQPTAVAIEVNPRVQPSDGADGHGGHYL